MKDMLYNGKTDIGHQRIDNQDTFLATEISFMGKKAVLLSVIDGVGGYIGGDVASSITAESIKKYLDGFSLQDPVLGLEQSMINANNNIASQATQSPEYSNMGCVASTCVIDDSYNMYYAHLGDSRIYVYQDGQLSKITHDHSLIGYLEDEGELSEQEAMTHPDRNIISKMLGQDKHHIGDNFIECGTLHLNGACQILLCTDGLTDQLNTSEIKAVLDKEISPEAKISIMIAMANEKGGKDNVTVVLADVNAPLNENAPKDLYDEQKKIIQNNKNMRSRSKALSLIVMLIVSIGILLSFRKLYQVQQPVLENVEQSYIKKRSVCLDKDMPFRTLESMLQAGGFFPDANDARCISRHIVTTLADNQFSIKKLGELNQWKYQIPALTASNSNGLTLKALADSSFRKIGVSSDIISMYDSDSIPNVTTSGNSIIEVRIVDYKDESAVPGTIVRLKEHYYEDVMVDSINKTHDSIDRDSILAYAKTDSLGYVRFNVNRGCSYSVLPIKMGFQYGTEKGTVGGVLIKNKETYVFKEREHRICMFPGSVYSDIKSSMSMTVRTPKEYINKMMLSLIIFLLSWWLAFVFVAHRDKKMVQQSEIIIIPILMLVSGIGMLAQFSMLNPLTDSLLGYDTACTIALAILLFIILQRLDIVRWYASDYRFFKRHRLLFDPFMGSTYNPVGITYIILAVGLMLALAFFGTSPEGSDAKISLFGLFQPADLCKFLIVIFLAAFFTSREQEIRAFSSYANRVSLFLQVKNIALVCICIFVVCSLYLTVLSDLGSGLICVLVFIVMYTCSRGDIKQLCYGVLSYISLIILAHHFYSTALGTVALVSIIWLVGWISLSLITRKVIYESAIFSNLLIFILVAGGPIMKSIPITEHQGQRLIDRTDMTYSGVWENDVEGVGDQVFLAVKSISAGGMLGQGLGKGHPNQTPAFTTDMIVASISEQMGYVVCILLMATYLILAYYGINTAVKSGHKFVYYLVSGITMATVIQWIVIVGATIGIISLTGIPAPFLAFGKSSLLFHILAYSLVISASRYSYGYFTPIDTITSNNRTAFIRIYCVISIVIAVYGLRYAYIDRNNTIARPGVFVNDGELSVQYDPRINIILDKIEAGDIYDRNGVLIATSSHDKLLEYKSVYLACGIQESMILNEAAKNQRRYYGFGSYLSFVLGDFNNKSLWANSQTSPYGLGIEHRFFSLLRGFDSRKRDMYGNKSQRVIEYRQKRQDRFLPERSNNVRSTITLFDYSPIVELVKDGEDGIATRNWNAGRNHRDITLSIDAKLQTILQFRMAEYIANDATLSKKNKLIGSVYIQEVNTGDMLASANYPLPQLDTILYLNSIKQYRYDESNPNTKAITIQDGCVRQTQCGSTEKVAVALAGMMKNGTAVCDNTYYIYPEEIIERGKVREPNNHYVSFEEAVRSSSNCYFVNYGLDNDVFEQLGVLNKIVGIRLDGHENRGRMIPYVFDMDEMTPELEEKYDKEVEFVRSKAIPLYNTYIKMRSEEGLKVRFNAFRGSADWWGWFYGQSTMSASPMNMARVISIIANDGKYVASRYILKIGEADVPVANAIDVVPSGTERLLNAMCSEAQKHNDEGCSLPVGVDGIGAFFSKTGTPERGLYTKDNTGNLFYSKPNDGWFIFGLPCLTTNSYLAVAIRLERLGNAGSSVAVKFASEVVIPAIKECGYQID